MNNATLIFSDGSELAIAERSSAREILIEGQTGEEAVSAIRFLYAENLKAGYIIRTPMVETKCEGGVMASATIREGADGLFDVVANIRDLTPVEQINDTVVELAKMQAETLPDSEAEKVPYLFEEWAVGVYYEAGRRIRYNELLYRVLQSHTSQDDWRPDETRSLYVRTSEPAEEWPEWIQPTGAHDAYNTGDKVSHTEKHWTSDVDGNVWEPGVYGWTEVVEDE